MFRDGASYIYTVDWPNINLERALLLDGTLQFSSTIKRLEAQVDVILQCKWKLPTPNVRLVTSRVLSIWKQQNSVSKIAGLAPRLKKQRVATNHFHRKATWRSHHMERAFLQLQYQLLAQVVAQMKS
jgi:hypothetical protein